MEFYLLYDQVDDDAYEVSMRDGNEKWEGEVRQREVRQHPACSKVVLARDLMLVSDRLIRYQVLRMSLELTS